jgi:diketogulonate reductase-like aldo/keto reductase
MHKATPVAPPANPSDEPTVALPGGARWPALGLGTWRMGESSASRSAEVAAVRAAIEMGWRVIDTAEMYGEGGAEEVVGAAVAQALAAGVCRREELFVVSKVYPHNASRRGVVQACEHSRARLGLDVIDLYLLHWRGGEPLAETVAGFEELQRRGWIRHWGVSNFDVSDMEELWAVPGGDRCAANQVYHSLGERGVEFALGPWLRERGVMEMAYSPIDQGALAGTGGARGHPPAPAAVGRQGSRGGHTASALHRVAERHGATPAQVALAALLAQPGVMPIPKASQVEHLRENWAARSLRLTAEDLAELDVAFPRPGRKRALAMI